MRETFRWYGPTTHVFPRKALKDHMLGDIKIKKGTALTVGIMYNHYNPKFWDNPNEFRPERWKDPNILKDAY